MLNDGTCYGRLVTQGKRKGHYSRHVGTARKVLLAAGPPPFKGAICRHLCVNDTNIIKRTGVNDFVCINPDHIEWNTYSQNSLDAADNGWKKYIPKCKPPKLRKLRPVGEPRSDVGKKHVMSDKPRKPRLPRPPRPKPRKERSDKGVSRTTPRKKNSVIRSNKGKKNVMSDKPRKERSDVGKKCGPYKLTKGTSND